MAGDEDPRVLVEVTGTIATITLNRPAKLNAIDPAMLEQLEAAVARLDRDNDVRVVLVQGAGERAFCVGADIYAWSALPPLDMWRWWIREGHRIFARLAALRQPTIAVLHGYTFGGGLELALATDIRLAATGIELAAPEITLGTLPGWGATQRLTQLIGAARAKQLIFTGSRIDAATAERWALVNEVVPPERLRPRARELAEAIAEKAPVAVQLAKQVIDGADGVATGISLEAIAGGLAATTDDVREGVVAFRERRPPHFRGQ